MVEHISKIPEGKGLDPNSALCPSVLHKEPASTYGSSSREGEYDLLLNELIQEDDDDKN